MQKHYSGLPYTGEEKVIIEELLVDDIGGHRHVGRSMWFGAEFNSLEELYNISHDCKTITNHSDDLNFGMNVLIRKVDGEYYAEMVDGEFDINDDTRNRW